MGSGPVTPFTDVATPDDVELPEGEALREREALPEDVAVPEGVAKADSAAESQPRFGKGQGARHVYEVLKNEILNLTLKPSHPLDETLLAARFGMSRSPIREALVRLSAEHLVVMLSNRSTQVAPLDLESYPKYVEALDVLQRINCRLAAELRSEEDIAAIECTADAFRAAVRSGDKLIMAITNKDFHMSVAEAGRNPYLIESYRSLLDEGLRILHLHFDFLEISPDDEVLSGEHDNLIEAIIAKDVARADAIAHAHTRQARDRFIRFLEHNHADKFSFDPPADPA